MPQKNLKKQTKKKKESFSEHLKLTKKVRALIFLCRIGSKVILYQIKLFLKWYQSIQQLNIF